MISPQKRLLFVDDDPQELLELRQSLHSMREQWEMDFVRSGEEAIDLLKTQQFDSLIADIHMPTMTGAELINEAGKISPNTVRFIRAGLEDKEKITKCILGTQQFLTKSPDPATLISSLSRALSLDIWIENPQLRALVGRIRTFPSLPSLYNEVIKELRSADSSLDRIADLIGKDLSMTTKILQLLNSAFYGLPRQITELEEAIGLLGLDTVKSLVLGIQLFSQYDKVKPVFFSIDRLWKHSLTIAKAAREVMLLESQDETLGDEAYTAGLLHDLGQLVLVTNFDEQYHGAQSLARRNHLPLWEVERELFGVSHAEIGAYLLGLWGLPIGIVEAAALHHKPGRCANPAFCPLTAVHVTNALAHELFPVDETLISPKIDLAYVQKLGVADHEDFWRQMVRGKPASSEAEAAAEPKPAENAAPTRSQATATAHHPIAGPSYFEPAEEATGGRRWMLGVALVGLLSLVAIWQFRSQPPAEPVNEPENTNASFEVAPTVDATATNNTEAVVTTNAPVEPSPVPPDESTNAASVAAVPENPVTDATNAPVVLPSETVAPPAPKPFPLLQLQQIDWEATQPSVTINGQTLFAGGLIEGVRIMTIEKTNVVLDFEGQTTNLTLP